MERINIFDFDKTIYDGDSTVDFYLFCLKLKKKNILLFPRQCLFIFLYSIGKVSKEKMKEEFFVFLNNIDDVDKVLELFWNKNSKKIKDIFDKVDLNNGVVISASPEFLLEYPCKKLKVKKLIASIVDKKTGKFLSNNCSGNEKVNRLKMEYDNFNVNKTFTDSLSDLPILELAKDGYIVKGKRIIKYK